ncbi:MAG: secondary thiamine-phosphate synthase enzyme YjbQ [Planctomycetota bacterium]|jgi:secondary thiamine-phosphate synthase enzyme
MSHVETLVVPTPGRGLHEITPLIQRCVTRHLTGDGLCTVLVRHTSASLLIQENADPSAARDLEAFFARIAAEHDSLWTHTAEGPDDMPSHVRAALTATSVSIPVLDGRLGLGTWQGLFLFEHRRRPHRRELLVHVGS